MKQCSTCRTAKTPAEFTKNKNSSDGLHNQCKVCRKESDARRYQKDKVKLNAKTAAYAAAHPEVKKKSWRKWAGKNTGRRAFYHLGYRQRNRGKFCEYENKRRAQKALTAVGPVCRREAWERDGGICHVCKKPVPFESMHLDHVKPLARGGSHTMENVAPAHEKCNRRKWAN